MAIQKNAGGGGNFISQPGEYLVKVVEMKTGLSKSKKSMLTVTFHTLNDEQSIRGFFVRESLFQMKKLELLKIAAGLKVTDHHEKLHQKEVGILVELQKPDENGVQFPQIVGYGPAKDVTSTPQFEERQPGDDDIPF